MKKIFMFIAGVAAAMTMQAATYTEAAQITMTCDGGSEMQELQLFVNPALSSPVTVPNLASTYEIGQVNMYVSYNSGKYSSFKANAISNLPLTIVTNRRDVSYTFMFNVPIATAGLTLTDLRSNEGVKTMPITHNGSYTFTVGEADGYEANKNITIADRFVINYVAPVVTGYNVTLNGAGLASFSADGDDATIPDGVEAYTATYQAATQEIVLNKITATAIPAGVGVILYGTPDAAVTLPYTDGAAALTAENDLYPATAWAGADKNNVFVLSGNQMFKYVGTDPVPANKAFMKLPGGANNAPARISMRFNTTTAVENVETEAVQPVKFIENGEIFIRRGNEVYNLQGQLVK